MRLKVLLVLTIPVVEWATAQTTSPEHSTKTIYFLKDDARNEWCGYASEAQFKSQVEPRMAREVGGADYDSYLTTVHFTEEDETGDWTVFDEYTLDKSGVIRSLIRKIEIIPENAAEQYRFRIENGKAVTVGTTFRELDTGRPRKRAVGWFKQPPIVTDPKTFSFWRFLQSEREEVLSKGEACTPVSRN
jgi:hypothetical protein